MTPKTGRSMSLMLALVLGTASAAGADILCKDNSSGNLKVRTGPNCPSGETKLPIQFLNNNTVVQITAANLQVVSGGGSTAAAVPGLGNLIVGYNEDTTPPSRIRTGWHNIVIGREHAYRSFGGVVSGNHNDLQDEEEAAIGGQNNTVSGEYAATVGGQNTTASGDYATVTGGIGGTASGKWANVSAGNHNTAYGTYAWVGTGADNVANGAYGAIVTGTNNIANFTHTAVVGGSNNVAAGFASAILGGANNETQGGSSIAAATICGGNTNVAKHNSATVGGTCNQTTTADCTFLP